MKNRNYCLIGKKNLNCCTSSENWKEKKNCVNEFNRSAFAKSGYQKVIVPVSPPTMQSNIGEPIRLKV